MTFDLEIDGEAKQLRAGTLDAVLVANGRSTASFEIISEDRTYRPSLDAEVFLWEDGDLLFGGLVDKPDEEGLGGGTHPAITTQVNVVSFDAYAERRVVNETIPADTLKAALQVLEPYLTPYGVALDASQVDGPTLPELTYEDTRLDTVLNELATLTADAGQPYVWEISAGKKLRMFQPNTLTAPFDLVGNDLSQVRGDIRVETSRSDDYANKIILKAAPRTEVNHVETFTGDGTTTSFDLAWTPLKIHNYVVLNNGVPELLTWQGIGFDLAVQWLFYPPASTGDPWTMRRETTGVPDPPASGHTISVTFEGTFSGRWEAEDASFATDPWERVITIDALPEGVAGQAFADAELAKRVQENKTVHYVTWEPGIFPGQQQTINVPARDVNANAVVSSVRIRDLVKYLQRSVTAVVDAGQTNLSKGFQDDYKIWYGDKTGGASSSVRAGTGTPVATGPAPPDKSVQFNNSGVFGGDADFIYYEDENSLVCGGGGSSITAGDFESCQAFGYDCHIGDP